MKWIASLDELLYEVTGWLLFFPLTLWRCVVRPLETMDYGERQLALPEKEQYSAALSPPLFLAIALLVAHFGSAALGQPDEIVSSQRGMARFITDDTSALLLRLIVFGSFPILAAARLARRRHLPVDRETLRRPFYGQCYPTAVLALGLAIGVTLVETVHPAAHLAGGLLIGASLLNFVTVETRWFADKLGIGYFRAFGAAGLGLIEGFGVLIAVAYLLKG